jgi:hypothetical protein
LNQQWNATREVDIDVITTAQQADFRKGCHVEQKSEYGSADGANES